LRARTATGQNNVKRSLFNSGVTSDQLEFEDASLYLITESLREKNEDIALINQYVG